MAAGEPALAAPSKNIGSISPIIMTCTRRSSLMCAIVAFTSSIAPVLRRIFSMTNAPKTISTILRPSLIPFQISASKTVTFSANEAPVTLKYVNPKSNVQISAKGATLLAGCLKPNIPTGTTISGLSTNTKFINRIFGFSFKNPSVFNFPYCRPDKKGI